MMRYYIDCEFDGHHGSLLSIALVTDGADSIHIQADVEPMDLWVRRNVLPIMDAHKAPKSAKVYHDEVGGVIRAFIDEDDCPVIVADSPVDIGRFCRALSTGPDGQWASANYPAMRFEVHNVDCYPTTLVGAVQHNAWWDAMALREKLNTRTTALAAQSERIEALEGALQKLSDALTKHHQWHAAQTTPDPEYGFIPADEYGESAIYEQTVAALHAAHQATGPHDFAALAQTGDQQ